MMNVLNAQNHQTNSVQNSTTSKGAVSFSERFNELAKGKNYVIFLSGDFKARVSRQVSQTYSVNEKISQGKYEKSVQFIINKMQDILNKMSEDSQTYELANKLYGNFLHRLNPEPFVLLETGVNQFKLTDIQAPRNVFVEFHKNKSIQALQSNDYKANDELAKLKDSIGRYEASLKQIAVQGMEFFSTFESEFSQSEIQEIIAELATIKAYNNYEAHNITLSDGSIVSWEYDINGQMVIKINEFDINTALENADKALTEMENFKTLLEMFKQRENLNGLESGLNSENLHSNSHSNLTNSSENLGKNSNLQTKINFINSSTNLSKTNSNGSLLKALLNSVSNDENLLKDLKV